MGRINPIPMVAVMGVVLFGCASTQRNTSEALDTSPDPAPQRVEGPTAHATAAQPTSQTAPSVPDIRATCALEVQRQIDCVDEYLPMIVDTRIELDLPSGMAEKGRDGAGRAELLAVAMQEFPEYYAVDKIPAICEQRQAMVERMPAQLLQELNAMGPDCHTAEDCRAFTRCVAPIVRKILAMTASSAEH